MNRSRRERLGGLGQGIPAPTPELSFSKYTHVIDAGVDHVVAYSNVHFDPVVLPRSEWKQLRSGNDISRELRAHLAAAGLLADQMQDDITVKRAKVAQLQAIDTAQVLYLVASDSCDLACSYCPVPVRQNSGRHMPPSLFEEFYEPWVKAAEGVAERYILLYGGEPLENLPLLRHLAENYERLAAIDDAGLEILVCTNLTALTDEAMELLAPATIKVVVGLDPVPSRGGRESRVSVSGAGTYAATLAAARRLIDRGVETYASTTLMPDAAGDIVGHLRGLSKMGFQGAGLNLLRGSRGMAALREADLTAEEYVRLVVPVFGQIAEDSRLREFEYNTARRLGRLSRKQRLPEVLAPDCHAYGNQVVLYPDGSQGACYLKGDREKLSRTSSPDPLAAVTRLPLFRTECDACAARPICGGGCPWSAEEVEGNPARIDRLSCLVTQAVAPDVIRVAVTS